MARNKLHLLLADSSPIARNKIAEFIDAQPDMTVVGTASEGLEAVDLVDDLEPDIVLLEITLPNLNGIAVTRTILERHPSVRILALTFHNDRRFLEKMLEVGASGYLLKDGPLEDLLAAIRGVAEGRMYFADTL